MVRDARKRVRRVVEHGDASASELRIREWYAGFLSAPVERLAKWLAKVKPANAQKEYYLTDVIALAAKDGVVVATVKAQDPWEVAGVNSRHELALLERAYQNMQARKLLDAGVALADLWRVDVRGELACGRDVAIDVNCIFEGIVKLGDRVRIGTELPAAQRDGRCRHRDTRRSRSSTRQRSASAAASGPLPGRGPASALANEVHIGNFVEVKASRIGAGSKANHLSYIGDAEVGARVNIGAGTITCNYDGAAKHRTVIEDDCFIGSDATLVAPVTHRQGLVYRRGLHHQQDHAAGPAHGGAREAGVAAELEGAKEKIAMCGIVGAAARRDIVPVLIEGLRRLEYRGYDSCGVATLGETGLARVRSVERVEDLAGQVRKQNLQSETGIAHTRWATHGAPVTRNAHPMMSRGEIALVHNGIIENYEELRAELKAQGLRVREPDRHRGDHAPGAQLLPGGPVPGRAPRREARQRCLCNRSGGEEPAASRGRRARGQPAGDRRGQGRDVPRLGCPRTRRHHRAHCLPRGG